MFVAPAIDSLRYIRFDHDSTNAREFLVLNVVRVFVLCCYMLCAIRFDGYTPYLVMVCFVCMR